jgi:hypothetical protein
MTATNGNSRAFRLPLRLQPHTGQLLGLAMPDGTPLLTFREGAELRVNGQPLSTILLSADQSTSEHVTLMEAHLPAGYGAGSRWQIRRVITLGGTGLHSGRSHSAHLRYELRRIPNTVPGDTVDYIWQPELEAPLRLDTVDTLTAPTDLLGPQTRMRALAIGGSGPREHVSFEDAPVADVVPLLGRGFRATFPGQPTINGALLHHPEDHRYLWAIVRRPSTGGRMDFDDNRLAFRFYYFQDMPLQQEVTTPAISLMWGHGLDDAERVLAEQFDQFEEPPDWWYHTTWFWLHPNWQKDGSFRAMGEGADILHEQCGVNGFGLFVHDVPWAGNDCDVTSPQPNPALGGERALREVLRRFNDRGIHSYVWMSQKGHRPDGPGYRDEWAIQGIDGRPIRLHNRPDSGVRLDIIDPADPSFFQYICDWIRYYVCDLGVTGIFWDSGFQPVPPDFGNKPYLRFPAQSMAAMLEFYRKVYRFGRSLSPDFFMWAEGINTDMPMNAFAVDKRDHEGGCGHALMHRIAHRGPQRLVWRSAWSHDVAGAFPFISPVNDVGWRADDRRYAEVAADPMNKWLCQTVRERHLREARGLGRGISQLDEFIIVSPKAPGQSITLPTDRAADVQLTPVAGDAAPVKGVPLDGAMSFTLRQPGAYRIDSRTMPPGRARPVAPVNRTAQPSQPHA